jgi:hypothetical protein
LSLCIGSEALGIRDSFRALAALPAFVGSLYCVDDLAIKAVAAADIDAWLRAPGLCPRVRARGFDVDDKGVGREGAVGREENDDENDAPVLA